MAERVLTFGCRLNALESEVMRARADAAGMGDAILVNTCAVTNEAVRQARQAIRKARRENPQARIVVSGCAAQIDPDSFGGMDEVDLVLGNAEKLAEASYRLPDFGVGDTATVRVNDIMSVEETAGHLIKGMDGRARAFVEIQNGCDHRCTFCVIPYGRGNSRSVPMGAVVDQVRRLVENGYREVVLTGVDITSYGADLPGSPKLGRLTRAILKLVPELERLRLSSINSIEVDEALLTAIAEEERLMPHFHLSLQHGDDMILKRMKRRHVARRLDPLRRDRAAAAARRRLRRRPDRRLPDRERGDVRQHARHRRRLRPDPSPRLSLLAAARARRRRACRSSIAPWSRNAPARLRAKGESGARRASRRRTGRRAPGPGRARGSRPHRAFHPGRNRCRPARRGDRRADHRP